MDILDTSVAKHILMTYICNFEANQNGNWAKMKILRKEKNS